MLPAQHTGFNTLDNWGHKTPTQSKRKRTGKKRLNGHGLGHADIHLVTIDLFQATDKVSESNYVTKTMVKITKPVPNVYSQLVDFNVLSNAHKQMLFKCT